MGAGKNMWRCRKKCHVLSIGPVTLLESFCNLWPSLVFASHVGSLVAEGYSCFF